MLCLRDEEYPPPQMGEEKSQSKLNIYTRKKNDLQKTYLNLKLFIKLYTIITC